MSPDIEPREPTPIDPPDNTRTGATNMDEVDPTASEDLAQAAPAPAINPPDNT